MSRRINPDSTSSPTRIILRRRRPPRRPIFRLLKPIATSLARKKPTTAIATGRTTGIGSTEYRVCHTRSENPPNRFAFRSCADCRWQGWRFLPPMHCRKSCQGVFVALRTTHRSGFRPRGPYKESPGQQLPGEVRRSFLRWVLVGLPGSLARGRLRRGCTEGESVATISPVGRQAESDCCVRFLVCRDWLMPWIPTSVEQSA